MINGVTTRVNIDTYIMNAIREDITSEDVTTNAIMPEPRQGKADLICKEDGIICGLEVFKRTFELLDDTAVFEAYVKDGDEVKKGQLMGVIKGDIKALLSGERTALNYLQRMSGIATYTKMYAKELEGKKTKLLDTRKTTPNMRPFEKYAVKVGGGTNHRYNLSDGVLIKDNHIGAAGSITKAVAMAKEYAPFVRKIESLIDLFQLFLTHITFSPTSGTSNFLTHLICSRNNKFISLLSLFDTVITISAFDNMNSFISDFCITDDVPYTPYCNGKSFKTLCDNQTIGLFSFCLMI